MNSSSNYNMVMPSKGCALLLISTLIHALVFQSLVRGLSSPDFIQRTKNHHPSLQFTHSPRLHQIRCYLAQDDHSEKRNSEVPTLHNVLTELNNQFQYEGRLPSYLTSAQSNDSHTKQYSQVDTSRPYRCGFVAVVGAPNMGKSSLVNALLQEELCIATHRPQTTRHAILAVLNSPHPSQCQLCFLDTPGIIDKPAYKLQEGMMEAVQGAFHDADVLLVVTDVFSTPIPSDVLFQRVVQLSQSNQKKVIIAINKVDLLSKVGPKNQRDMENHIQDGMGHGNTQGIMEKPSTMQDIILHWRRLVPDAIAIIPLCASTGGKDIGVEALRTLLLGGSDVTQAFEKLGGPFPGMFLPHVSMIQEEDAQSIIPISPPLYSLDTLTDRNSRFFASEIIRGSLFCKLGKELPYCCEVRIDEFVEPKSPVSSKSGVDDPHTKRLIRIKATIHVERDSQKSIVIGKGGEKIKEVGMDARVKLEEFLQEKVHLDLFVKVDRDWRKNEAKLKAYGYLR